MPFFLFFLSSLIPLPTCRTHTHTRTYRKTHARLRPLRASQRRLQPARETLTHMGLLHRRGFIKLALITPLDLINQRSATIAADNDEFARGNGGGIGAGQLY